MHCKYRNHVFSLVTGPFHNERVPLKDVFSVLPIFFVHECSFSTKERKRIKCSNKQTGQVHCSSFFLLSSDPVSHIRAREFQGQDQYDDPHTGINTMPAHHQYTVSVSQWGQNITLS